MNTRDIYNSKAIALHHTTAGSNKIPYLGQGLFPAKKKASLDLKWIKTHKGVPVTLAPSAFDTKSTIRSRQGIKIDNTEMAYFKESMLLKEQDEQDIMRLTDTTDPFAQEVVAALYDDAEVLVDGANVVPERMRMSLLCSANGHPSISIAANGATYAYNYDADGSYASNNFVSLTGTSAWSDTTNSDPISDINVGKDAVEALTGTVPSIMIVGKDVMNYLVQNAKVRNYVLSHTINPIVTMTKDIVKNAIKEACGVDIIVYSKLYVDETGTTQKFYKDGFATLIPEGTLGSTWYGMTPEERTLVLKKDADVSIVDGGVTIAVTITDDPVQTKTTVSEIVLPSFERMDETYTIKCY